jgi:hypothetical protein
VFLIFQDLTKSTKDLFAFYSFIWIKKSRVICQKIFVYRRILAIVFMHLSSLCDSMSLFYYKSCLSFLLLSVCCSKPNKKSNIKEPCVCSYDDKRKRRSNKNEFKYIILTYINKITNYTFFNQIQFYNDKIKYSSR